MWHMQVIKHEEEDKFPNVVVNETCFSSKMGFVYHSEEGNTSDLSDTNIAF